MAFNQGFGTFGNSNVGVPNFRKTATGINQEEDPFDIKNSELFKNSSNLATQQMSGELPGWSEQSNISREAYQSGVAAQNKAKREALFNSGLRDSGKFLEEGYIKPAAEQERGNMDFERNLLAKRAEEVRLQQQAGQTAATDLLGYLQTQSENELNRRSSETIAEKDRELGYKKLEEDARQFGITDEKDKAQFKETMKYNYDQLSQEQKNFLLSFGLDQANFEQRKKEYDLDLQLAKDKMASENAIAYAGLAIEKDKLNETARQYNMTYDQVNQQFRDKLKFDYTTLDQDTLKFYESLGFDREKFEQAKKEFQMNYSLEKQLRTRDLDLKEQEIANQASQFDSRLDFDVWATQAGLDDKAADRIWQATQNDKALANARDVAKMQNDTERWKTTKAEELTREGWSVEAARASADRQQELIITNLNNALTREIEAGRITLAQAELLQKANQFTSDQDFEREMSKTQAIDDKGNLVYDAYGKPVMIDRETAQRLWATNERLGAEAAAASAATFQAQLEKELASGTWVNSRGETVSSMAAQELIEKARQYDTSQEWAEEAAKQGFDSWDAMRAYEKKDKIEGQEFTLRLQNMKDALTREGWNMTAISSALETLPAEQAAQLLNKFAIGAGITYTVKGDDGKPLMTTDENGKQVPVVASGFEPTGKVAYNSNKDLNTQLSIIGKAIDKLPPTEVQNILTGYDTYAQNYPNLFATKSLESFPTVAWNKNTDSWKISDEGNAWLNQNVGKYTKGSDGNLYKVIGKAGSTDRNGTSYIVLRDVKTGNVVKYSTGVGGSKTYNYV